MTEPKTPTRPVTGKVGASDPVSGTDTVTIACKLPNGIIIRAQRWVETTVPMPSGGLSTQRQSQEIPGTRFFIRGWGDSVHQPANVFDRINGNFPGGFAITPGCPRDVWENFVEFSKGAAFLEEGLVFAVPTIADAEVEAATREAIRSGLEPIDPAAPEKTVPVRVRNQLGQLSQISQPT